MFRSLAVSATILEWWIGQLSSIIIMGLSPFALRTEDRKDTILFVLDNSGASRIGLPLIG